MQSIVRPLPTTCVAAECRDCWYTLRSPSSITSRTRRSRQVAVSAPRPAAMHASKDRLEDLPATPRSHHDTAKLQPCTPRCHFALRLVASEKGPKPDKARRVLRLSSAHRSRVLEQSSAYSLTFVSTGMARGRHGTAGKSQSILALHRCYIYIVVHESACAWRRTKPVACFCACSRVCDGAARVDM